MRNQKLRTFLLLHLFSCAFSLASPILAVYYYLPKVNNLIRKLGRHKFEEA